MSLRLIGGLAFLPETVKIGSTDDVDCKGGDIQLSGDTSRQDTHMLPCTGRDMMTGSPKETGNMS